MNYFPILDEIRSNSVDSRYFGLAFLYSKKGKLKGRESGAKFYLRSTMKPIPASILDEKIVDFFKFEEKELAVMQGSHSGEKIHVELVQSVLNKIGLNENALLCPVIPPLNSKVVIKYSSNILFILFDTFSNISLSSLVNLPNT